MKPKSPPLFLLELPTAGEPLEGLFDEPWTELIEGSSTESVEVQPPPKSMNVINDEPSLVSKKVTSKSVKKNLNTNIINEIFAEIRKCENQDQLVVIYKKYDISAYNINDWEKKGYGSLPPGFIKKLPSTKKDFWVRQSLTNTISKNIACQKKGSTSEEGVNQTELGNYLNNGNQTAWFRMFQSFETSVVSSHRISFQQPPNLQSAPNPKSKTSSYSQRDRNIIQLLTVLQHCVTKVEINKILRLNKVEFASVLQWANQYNIDISKIKSIFMPSDTIKSIDGTKDLSKKRTIDYISNHDSEFSEDADTSVKKIKSN